MLRYLLIGTGYALSAGLQPGPLQAFFLARVTEDGWRRTLPAAFAPLISDGPIALIALLLLSYLPDGFRDFLQLAGGFLLLTFAWSSYNSWKNYREKEPEDSFSTPKTIFQAALVNILNPNPYLGWSLVMGPAVLAAWNEGPLFAVILLVSFYITMISISLILIALMGTTTLLGSTARRKLTLISALLLGALGVYFMIHAGFILAGNYLPAAANQLYLSIS
ncbi:MAG: LysE family transporter [Anaerolineales bacterium]|nr:LysE family transporter [Anaerolineales bacterium]